MIIFPVVSTQDGSKNIMLFITPRVIEALQREQLCVMSSPDLETVLGVKAVVVRYAESDAAAAAQVQRMIERVHPGTTVKFELQEFDIDAIRRSRE